MKKILLIMVAFVMCMIAAVAQTTATFDFTNPTSLSPAVTPSETASTGVTVSDQVFTSNGITFVATQGGTTDARLWTTTSNAVELRLYKTATITISSTEGKNITSIAFAGSSVNGMTVETGAYESGTWTGSATSVVFTLTANLKVNTVTVTLEGEGGSDGGGETTDPDKETKTTLFSETFASSLGSFTADNKTLPEASTYVWTAYSKGSCAKASSYINKTNYASESWLISPEIDCTKATALSLTFEHALNYGTVSEMQNQQKLYVREKDGDWKEVTIATYPDGTSWTFVSTTQDISAFDGKTIQFAFAYTSSTESCATWEVKNVKVEGIGEGSVVEQNYTSISDLQADATSTQTAATFTTSDLLILGVGKRGSNYTTYVSDGTGYATFYGPNEPIGKKGDKISGTLTGNLCIYNNAIQLSAIDYSNAKVISSDNEVTPEVVLISTLGNDTKASYQSRYVRLENVTFASSALESSNISITDDEDNSIVLRDNFSVLTDFVFDTSKQYNVNAYVSYYKDVAQLYVCSAEDVQIITNLKDAETAWTYSSLVVKPGDTLEANELKTQSDGAKTFTSSNEKIATVDAEGNVTVVGFGHVVITVETAETASYLASKASYDIYIIEGEGSFEKPYGASDVEYFNGSVTDKVWVKGTIIGYISDTSKGTYSPADDNTVATNLALGTEDAYIPVQLPKGTVREALNLVDNPTLQGTTVWLYGNLATYCGKPGLKNVTEFSLDGVTAISAVEAAPADNAAVIYSIDGRRLSKAVKGVNIINGKKVVLK